MSNAITEPLIGCDVVVNMVTTGAWEDFKVVAAVPGFVAAVVIGVVAALGQGPSFARCRLLFLQYAFAYSHLIEKYRTKVNGVSTIRYLWNM